MAKQRVTTEICDNPECRYQEIVTKEEPATGYHFGRGFWVLGGGGPIEPFYAHDEDCIVPALKAVMERR